METLYIFIRVLGNFFNPFIPKVPFWFPWKHQRIKRGINRRHSEEKGNKISNTMIGRQRKKNWYWKSPERLEHISNHLRSTQKITKKKFWIINCYLSTNYQLLENGALRKSPPLPKDSLLLALLFYISSTLRSLLK